MKRRGAWGLALAATGLLSLAALGLFAVAVDVARLYVVRSEVRAYAQAVAAAAVQELDGTLSGIDRARRAVADGAKRWNLTAAWLGEPETEFAASPSGPWRAKPDAASAYRFVRIRASATVPLLFLPSMGQAAVRTVRADAVAGCESWQGNPGPTSSKPLARHRMPE